MPADSRRSRRVVLFASGFVLLGLIAGWVTPLEMPSLRAAALTLGLGIVLTGGSNRKGSAALTIAALAACLLIFFAATPVQALFCLAAATAVSFPWPGAFARGLRTALLGAGGVLLIYHTSPAIAAALNNAAASLTKALSPGGGLILGWNESGLFAMGAAMAAVLSAAGFRRGRIIRALAAAAGFAVAWIVLVNLRAHFPEGNFTSSLVWQLGWLEFLGLASGWAVSLVSCGSSALPTRARSVRIILAAGLTAIFCLVIWFGLRPGAGLGHPLKIGLWQGKFIGTWEMPSWERPGVELTSAHFGMLPSYLKAFGWKIETFGPDLTSDRLAGLDAVLVINPLELSDGTVSAFRDFVSRGGGLLVAGDHTNMFGVRAPVNRLLAGTGLSLGDDTVIPARETWPGSLDIVGDRWWTAGVSETLLGYGVGASLDVRRPGRPLLIGRAAFADGPNPDDPSGNHIGDYTQRPGEPIGGLTLVAWAPVGRGRLVACGDTSMFQSLSLRTSQSFVRHLFEFAAAGALSGGPAGRVSPWGLLYPALLGVFGLLALFLAGGIGPLARALVPLAFAAVIATASFSARAEVERFNAVPGSRVAAVDLSHANAFDPRGATDDSVDGLYLNLMRAGYLPVNAPRGLAGFAGGAGVEAAIVIAPTRPLGPAERDALLDLADKGGLVLIAAGAREEPFTRDLLAAAGLKLRPVALGPVPYLDSSTPGPWTNQPRFSDTWPLEIDPAGPARSLYGVELGGRGWDIIAEAPRGRGRILVIADPRFFCDMNLEAIGTYWKPNIDLLRQLLGGNTDGKDEH
jgi:hypothetical protein